MTAKKIMLILDTSLILERVNSATHEGNSHTPNAFIVVGDAL